MVTTVIQLGNAMCPGSAVRHKTGSWDIPSLFVLSSWHAEHLLAECKGVKETACFYEETPNFVSVSRHFFQNCWHPLSSPVAVVSVANLPVRDLFPPVLFHPTFSVLFNVIYYRSQLFPQLYILQKLRTPTWWQYRVYSCVSSGLDFEQEGKVFSFVLNVDLSSDKQASLWLI